MLKQPLQILGITALLGLSPGALWAHTGRMRSEKHRNAAVRRVQKSSRPLMYMPLALSAPRATGAKQNSFLFVPYTPALRSLRLGSQAPAIKKHHVFPSLRWGGLSMLAGAGLGWAAAGKSATPSQRWHSAAVYGLTAGAWTETGLALLRPHPRVRWSWQDDWLAGGIMTVQTLDYLGTRDFRRAGYNEWLLSNAEVDRRPQLYLTEAAVAGAGIGVMFLLERAGHRQWAHWLAGLYIAAGLASYYNNEHYARTGQSWF